MAEFFDMGGYGVFVWSSYGISLFILGLIYVFAVRRHKNALQEAAKRAKREMTK